MDTAQEWTTVDKSTWGPGPWQNEPDKIHWIDPETDLDCLMVRNGSGAWCGYVAVTEGHPYFAVPYSGCVEGRVDDDGEPERYCDHEPRADVHGGLTYAAFCMETDDPADGVCHVPLLGRPDRVWWFGFDCCHYRDLAPGMAARERAGGWSTLAEPKKHYRDRRWVESEVRSLARQLVAVAS